MFSTKKDFFAHLEKDNSQVIDCSNKELKGSDLPEIIKIIKGKEKVTKLNISYLGIGLENIELLKELVLITKGLQTLNLRENDLGNDGVLNMISDPKLIDLVKNIDFNFGNNDINDDGLKLLFPMAEAGRISPASLLSIIVGNPIYDEQLVEDCRNLYKAKTNKNVDETELRDDKESTDSLTQDRANTTGSAILPDHFFSKTATPRTSDTSSKAPSTPSSGTTSKTSTPPSDEVINTRTRKLSKSNDSAD